MDVVKFRAWVNNQFIEPHFLDGEWFIDYRAIEDYRPLINPVIEQYTGLKDKNGKYLYEGDIVTGFEINGTYTNYTTEFIAGSFSFIQIGCEGYFEDCGKYPQSTIEIIGNIHENPELL